ncbi:low temperature requirement protein A [Lactobacillus amylovorus]|uniref:Low temperature requirement protein A n=1 Tax=Lactobacillus amylovorus TaxID=1604 RepID=A0AAW6BAF5_LACAM|nr:low temperature requirement protein A [Lactobacillus amylovorus]MDA6089433.1 low temperature requirement protein A [Lactobacillus amylovorus]MDB6246697.1 low temperature requirement protein A [Lactobacillus amylovorus]
MKKIIAKPVGMFELFYDLVFVYAISKIKAMVHHPVNGGIPCLPVM